MVPGVSKYTGAMKTEPNIKVLISGDNSHSGSAVELLEEVEAVRGQERDVRDHSARGVSGPDQDHSDNDE